MDVSEHYPEAELDDRMRHPWERHRCFFYIQLLLRAVHPAEPAQAEKAWQCLDVGAGDAWFASQLLQRWPSKLAVTCWDQAYSQQRFERSGLRLVAEQPQQTFDLVLLLDVLEHVEADQAFLQRVLQQNARRGAWVLIAVPAWPSLFGPHDRALGHVRRYSRGSLNRLLAETDLSIRASGSLFQSLTLVRAAEKCLQQIGGHSSEQSSSMKPLASPLHWLLDKGLACDAWLSWQLRQCPGQGIGLSRWALCRY